MSPHLHGTDRLPSDRATGEVGRSACRRRLVQRVGISFLFKQDCGSRFGHVVIPRCECDGLVRPAHDEDTLQSVAAGSWVMTASPSGGVGRLGCTDRRALSRESRGGAAAPHAAPRPASTRLAEHPFDLRRARESATGADRVGGVARGKRGRIPCHRANKELLHVRPANARRIRSSPGKNQSAREVCRRRPGRRHRRGRRQLDDEAAHRYNSRAPISAAQLSSAEFRKVLS